MKVNVSDSFDIKLRDSEHFERLKSSHNYDILYENGHLSSKKTTIQTILSMCLMANYNFRDFLLRKVF